MYMKESKFMNVYLFFYQGILVGWKIWSSVSCKKILQNSCLEYSSATNYQTSLWSRRKVGIGMWAV